MGCGSCTHLYMASSVAFSAAIPMSCSHVTSSGKPHGTSHSTFTRGHAATDTEKEYLLPTGSEEREVLRVESIHVAILPSSQYMKMLHHNCIDMNIVRNRNKKHHRCSILVTIHPLATILYVFILVLFSITA